jgi:hypothetical protein
MHGYKKRRSFPSVRGRQNTTAYCGWVFVDNVPLLYERRRVARQLQIETWLDLAQIVRELELCDMGFNKRGSKPTMNYII